MARSLSVAKKKKKKETEKGSILVATLKEALPWYASVSAAIIILELVYCDWVC